MTNQKPVLSNQTTNNASMLAQIIKQLRLVWLLFQDNRVSIWVKSILPILFLYVISPLDILPDVFIGVGQLDDLGIVLLGLTLFMKLCPPDLVEYYQNQIDHGEEADKIIEVPYQQVNED